MIRIQDESKQAIESFEWVFSTQYLRYKCSGGATFVRIYSKGSSGFYSLELRCQLCSLFENEAEYSNESQSTFFPMKRGI